MGNLSLLDLNPILVTPLAQQGIEAMKVIYVLAGLVIVTALVMLALGPGMDLMMSRALAPPVDDGVELASLEPQHPGAISPPEELKDSAGVSAGWWFDEGWGVRLIDGNRWGRLNEKLEPTWMATQTAPFRKLVDLAGPSEVMVAVVKVEGARAELIVGLNREGRELWRHQLASSLFPWSMAALHGEQGPQGVVLVTESEEGLVAFGLDGQPLWNRPIRRPLAKLATNPALPGQLVRLSGGVEWISHDAESTSGQPNARERSSSRHGYFYAADGVLFVNRQGKPQLMLVGSSKQDGQWILSEGRDETWAWGIYVTDQDADREQEIGWITKLGTSNGVTYFALLRKDGTLIVLDEDGALLDRLRLSEHGHAPSSTWTSAVGGMLPTGEHAVVVGGTKGDFLLKVKLP